MYTLNAPYVLRICVSLLLLLLAPVTASAHVTSLATSEVSIAGDVVRYELTVSSHDLAIALGIDTDLKTPVPPARFEQSIEDLSSYLEQRLFVNAQDAACKQQPPEIDSLPDSDFVHMRIAYQCPTQVTRLGIRYELFFDVDKKHNNISVVKLPNRQKQFLLNNSFKSLELEIQSTAKQQSDAPQFAHVLVLGIEHILAGYDHILFLLALLIVSVRWRQIVVVVTAFTIAHSITLSLAWFGIVDLPSRLVESFIALSIAYVAIENLLRKGFGHRWLVAGSLGLVHGLGFYSVLSELGLGKGPALTTLVAFNLGVEVGQLAIVAVVFVPLVWWARQPWYGRSANVASMLILIVACWWLIERVFGLTL